ncbi:serine carboxypeptidase 1-like [Pistacia vera]|uniref:serine carboxypeptidase 1-like n=1 Tax=Pistacia vera TaxID=55513 RepID=UPI0012639242|nr:serine carboxypeptidase 1-like [Pistacia vera]XP_031249341.1 serine carboxypeptidase 1-like [Pistacia vera]
MAINNLLVFICCIFILSFQFSEAIQAGSLVTNLPGFTGKFPSKHYSGYVSVDEKNLFYYFVASERNPSKDPVVLWLNGGPGCSSFDGFVYEHGPFNFEEGNPKGSLPKLHLNPYSWTKVSSIIYLDSPAGVGLSYSKNESKYITGDIQTAVDTHAFLLKWFKLYPEFLNNPFYISGESYAGIYVPTLASQLVKGIKAGDKPRINFEGYLVGNGVTDRMFDGNALIPFAHGMGLISDDLFEEVEGACRGTYYDYESNDGCMRSMLKVDEALTGLNIYNILQPCFHEPLSQQDSNANSSLPASFQQLGATERPLKVRKRMFGRAWPLWSTVKDGIVTLWPQLIEGDEHRHIACVDDEVASVWLNNEAVRKALHADPVDVAGSWELCTDRITYHNQLGSMIPYHKSLTSQGYRALIFSGDHDMCVPFTGSQAWTRSLGYKKIGGWRSWISKGQIAGYLQSYDHNLTFLTVKGAGHTVPEYKPQEALDFYSRWLDGHRI